MTTRERLGGWHGGKGDRDRVSNKDKFNENFDKIFGEKKKKKDKECKEKKQK
jgi:hypothetical protein|tara:strand:+ start:230 stop:385 length:156 start_codon:yes stop_codon:yes gene_type:complete